MGNKGTKQAKGKGGDKKGPPAKLVEVGSFEAMQAAFGEFLTEHVPDHSSSAPGLEMGKDGEWEPTNTKSSDDGSGSHSTQDDPEDYGSFGWTWDEDVRSVTVVYTNGPPKACKIALVESKIETDSDDIF